MYRGTPLSRVGGWVVGLNVSTVAALWGNSPIWRGLAGVPVSAVYCLTSQTGE